MRLSKSVREAVDSAAPAVKRADAHGAVPPSRRRAGRIGLAAAAIVLALAGCGDSNYYYDPYDPGPTPCGATAVPAVVVQFVSRATGQTVPLNASGVLNYGGVSEAMIPWQTDGAGYGRLWSLAGGFDHAPDTFDVSVVTEAGERYDWPGVVVGAASCGPATVVLEAPVNYF